MDIRTTFPTRSAAGNLATALPFAIGPLTVDPPSRRISAGAGCEMIEPRVMRVLVALGEIPGRVLSRDELIEICWDGQIVTDNAVTRVISLLRHTFSDLVGDAVTIETISKVGFRLVCDGGAMPDQPSPVAQAPVAPAQSSKFTAFMRNKWTRRGALTAGLATAGVGATAAYMSRETISLLFMDMSAAELTRRGLAIQKLAEPGDGRRAMAYFRRATVVDPKYAPAWSALALSYRHPAQGPVDFIEPKMSHPRLIKYAAERALSFDPQNADAKLALIAQYPFFRHWREQEAHFRTFLKDHPNSALANGFLEELLQNVGRFEDAVPFALRAVEIDPGSPIAWAKCALCLHFAGRDKETEAKFDEATLRFPKHFMLYWLRFLWLVDSRRFAEAAAFARDPDAIPDMMGTRGAEHFAQLADALDHGTANRSTFDAMLCVCGDPGSFAESVPFPSLIVAQSAETSLLLDALEASLLGGKFANRQIPPPSESDTRYTFVLFTPGLLKLRDHPRYARLLEGSGLEDYWRKSRTQPDFRQKMAVKV